MAVAASLQQRIRRRFAERHSLLELAFGLLLSATFSVILADAFFPERVGNLEPLTVLARVTVTTLVVGAMITAAWLRRQLEFVVGTLAATSMLVLLLSRNTSFAAEEHSLDSGSTLLLLLTIATAAITFLFGGRAAPTSRLSVRQWTCRIGVICVVLLACAVVGRHEVDQLEADPRTPKIYTDEVQQISNEVRSLEPPKRKLFYQLASELQIADEYRKSFDALQVRLQEERQALAQWSSATSPDGLDAAAIGLDVVPEGELDGLAEHEANDQLAGTLKGSRPASLDPPKDQLDRLRLAELQHTVLLANKAAFAGRSREDRVSAMLVRLGWIHPLGAAPGEVRANAPLPGTDATSRYLQISEWRLAHVLGRPQEDPQKQPTPWAGLTNHFGLFPYEDITPERNDALFLRLAGQPSLERQLSWPQEAEGWAAYEQYRNIAFNSVPEKQRPLLQSYDALSDDQRDAIRKLIALSDDWQPRFDLLIALQRLHSRAATMDLAPLQHSQSPIALNLIAQGLKAESIPAVLPRNDPTEAEAPPEVQYGNQSLSELIKKLRAELNATHRETLAQLLEGEHPSIVPSLFSGGVLSWCRDVDNVVANRGADAQLEGGTERQRFFRLMGDPVPHALIQIAQADPDLSVASLLGRFRQLSAPAKESVLLRAAIELYKVRGDSALPPLEQIVYEARITGRALGIAVAGLFMLPFFVLATFVGTFLARKLRGHYRHRALLDRECREQDRVSDGEAAHILGTAVKFQGRDELLKSLQDLGKRGWTTTAIVGRRGVGKSRALYELLRGDREPAGSARIPVWVSVPTEFAEREFVV